MFLLCLLIFTLEKFIMTHLKGIVTGYPDIIYNVYLEDYTMSAIRQNVCIVTTMT